MIELMVIIVIIGTLAAIAVPKFAQASVKATIQTIKEEAMESNSMLVWKDAIKKINEVELPDSEELRKFKIDAIREITTRIAELREAAKVQDLAEKANSATTILDKDSSDVMTSRVEDFLHGEW